MNAGAPLRGLYAITSQAVCDDPIRLDAAVRAAISGGAVLLQYRDKLASPAQKRANAAHLLGICRQMGARLIVNDDMQLAAEIGADGVHLGQSDGAVAAAFLLFRVFDIAKPFPCDRCERLPTGLGIMADDWAAALG